MTLAKQMQNQIDYVRKEARVASMERVTQLTDENIKLGKQCVQLKCDLKERQNEVDILRADLARAGRREENLIAETHRWSKAYNDLKEQREGSRLPMILEEDMRRARSC